MPDRNLVLACAAAALGLLTDAAAQRVDVAVVAARDATLYDDPAGALSNGGGAGLFLGTNGQGRARRTLLHFDVGSAVPAGALVVFAEVRLTIAQTNDPSPRPVALYRVTADWNEGTTVAAGNGGGGAPAQPGDATWLYRSYPTTAWAAPGGDHRPTASTAAPMPTAGTFVLPTSRQLTDDVQSWVAGRAPNHGWLLVTDETTTATSRRFHSRESGVSGAEPQLIVGYLPAGTATSVGVGCVGSNNQQFQQVITGAPVGGTQMTLGMQGGQPYGFGITAIALGITDQPIAVGPNCSVWLQPGDWPTFGWRFFDANGQVTDTYAIPQDPGLLGVVLALQSVGFDPGIARGYVLANAHLLVFR